MESLKNYSEQTFESIKHVNDEGQEFWYARELQKILEYSEFNKFLPVIKKALTACEQSGNDLVNHFDEVSEMVQIGSGVERKFHSYKLSRYACYLIVMNADSRKEVISLGQKHILRLKPNSKKLLKIMITFQKNKYA